MTDLARFDLKTDTTFTVTGSTHARLSEQPKYFAFAGTNLVTNTGGAALVARITDAYGNQTFSGTSTVTLTAGAGSPDTLYGTKSATMASGSATLSSVQARKAGLYTIVPSVAGMTSVPTDTFRIGHAAPSKMTITKQPVDAKNGSVLASGPVLQVFDAFDNLADGTGFSPSTLFVTATATRVSGTGTTTPNVSFLQSADKGVITLTNFNVSGAITSSTVYTVTFTITVSGTPVSVVSAPITITP